MAASARRAGPEGMSNAMLLLVALWSLILFDPQWMLASFGLTPALKLPTVLLALLTVALVVGVPSTPSWLRRWTWYTPFLAFLLSGLPSYFIAINTGFAREGLKSYFLFWILSVGTATLVGSAHRAEQLLRLYGYQFLWWVAWGGTSAMVSWHHSLNNYDAFGAFMVGGVSICYFLAMGSPKKDRFRKIMFVGAFLCVLGVVASFARGAFLATITIYVLMWLRSPNKLLTLGAGVGMALVVLIAAVTLFPADFFYNEIMSAFSEGASSGTGEDRAILWQVALRVFEDHKIFGAGVGNVGAVGSTLFQPGDLGGMYAYNPGFLYGRSLHNIYFTILAEQGIVGSVIFVWVLVDFWWRNSVLRSKPAQLAWRELGGRLELRQVALGLELGMVAFLLTAFLYPMMEIHWFFTTLAINLTVHGLVARHRRSADRRVRPGTAAPVRPSAAIVAGRSPGPGFATRA